MIPIFFVILAFLCDFFTKHWVVKTLNYGDGFNVLPFFNIVHAKNFGVSFSLFSNQHKAGPILLCILALCIVIFLCFYLKKIKRPVQKWSIYAIIAGALSNAFDRVYYGSVVDFLDFYYQNYHWPAFNVADCFIVCGVFLFIISSPKEETKN
ncbi:MAG: Lipoprotein signal peptidase [Holosporales bacterium]